MIYLSSNCIKTDLLRDSVAALAQAGFRDIELSYGGRYYDGWEKDLFDLREKYDLNYGCHNYFVPVRDEFVINLASPDETVYHRSLDYLESAVALAARLGAQKYGFHAGFLVDLGCGDLGGSAPRKPLRDRAASLDRFAGGYAAVKRTADACGIKLYIENNVCSADDLRLYQGAKPFLLVDHADLLELKNRIDFNLLLDVGHLNVSCCALGLDFATELKAMSALSDYWHVSENDGQADQHRLPGAGSRILSLLPYGAAGERTVTLETRGTIGELTASFKIVAERLIKKEKAYVGH